HGLHHHRARPRRGAAGGGARDRDARRPRAEARNPRRDRRRRRRAGHLHRGRAPLMAWWSRARRAPGGGPVLMVERLDVSYGHALQQACLRLDRGVTAVVGRNGMGKSTLCNAITGLVPASGSVRLAGTEILGLPPNRITELGVGYVPQGRRVWPSLTVDEHLRLGAEGRAGAPAGAAGDPPLPPPPARRRAG